MPKFPAPLSCLCLLWQGIIKIALPQRARACHKGHAHKRARQNYHNALPQRACPCGRARARATALLALWQGIIKNCLAHRQRQRHAQRARACQRARAKGMPKGKGISKVVKNCPCPQARACPQAKGMPTMARQKYHIALPKGSRAVKGRSPEGSGRKIEG